MVLLDDHLLRDWLAGPDSALRRAIRRDSLATTNLFYARLCKSAAGQRGGALLGGWDPAERGALLAALVALPDEFEVVPMRDLGLENGPTRCGASWIVNSWFRSGRRSRAPRREGARVIPGRKSWRA